MKEIVHDLSHECFCCDSVPRTVRKRSANVVNNPLCRNEYLKVIHMYIRISDINISSIIVHIRFRSFSTLYTYITFQIEYFEYVTLRKKRKIYNCLKNSSHKQQAQSALLIPWSGQDSRSGDVADRMRMR